MVMIALHKPFLTDNNTTILLANGSLEESNGVSYEQSGILISTVLKFLNRCEDDTFVKLMLDVDGGNLTSPQAWVNILIKVVSREPSCRLHIAQNIGPLVRCMCNDTKRQFFKSNKHWRDTIQAFAALIHNMILHSVKSDGSKDKEIIDTLLNYEVLLTSIIQWGFWEEVSRPDIAMELKTDDRIDIVEPGKVTLDRLIKSADTQTEEVRKRLKTIASTPIISIEYDPEYKISIVVSLIRQTKIEGWTMDASVALRCLIANLSCVDKDVITEMIGLGFNTSDDKWVANVALVLDYMILKKYNDGMYYANDTRVAFAIRGGLIELCLTFIKQFGVLESFGKEKGNILSPFTSIKSILSNIYWIGLHKKTAKAIRSKICDIEQKLARLEQNKDVTNNVNCKKLIEITRSILDTNGSYCCRCNKSLSRMEVKQCNGCSLMSYFSRACQKEDWRNGHKLACCTSYTNETSGRFQGRLKPRTIPVDERAAATLKEIEVNMNMTQLKLFFDNSETILSQVKDLDIPLYDCVVLLDLSQCPLTVES